MDIIINKPADYVDHFIINEGCPTLVVNTSTSDYQYFRVLSQEICDEYEVTEESSTELRIHKIED